MDDADKSSAPSIPVPGCMPRRSSCYGRCFARSGPPDAALRLARRKRGTSLPRPQSASAIRSGVIRNPLEHKSVMQIHLDGELDSRSWIPVRRVRKSIFHPPLRSRHAGSIGLCGRPYCRRPGSGSGRAADRKSGWTKLDGQKQLSQTATNCNKLQQTATNCNKLQQTATNCNKQTRTIKFMYLIFAIL